MLWALYSEVILVQSAIPSWYHLKAYMSWRQLCPAQQPKKVNQKGDQTMKSDRIQKVWTRMDRKWSIRTYSRTEEKPKTRYWSADSWPNFLRDNSKNSHIFL